MAARRLANSTRAGRRAQAALPDRARASRPVCGSDALSAALRGSLTGSEPPASDGVASARPPRLQREPEHRWVLDRVVAAPVPTGRLALTGPAAECRVAPGGATPMERLTEERRAQPAPLSGERLAILLLLLVLAAASWLVLLQQAAMGMDRPSLTMGMGPALFLAV